MNCPVCATTNLKEIKLEEKLLANSCPQCHGHWIPADNYWKWMKDQGKAQHENPASFDAQPHSDTQKALICPDCGRILRKFRLGPELQFRLDHCGGCNGVWFDRDEWEILKAHNLHDHLHEFFTAAFQNKLRHQEARARTEAIYREKFGPDEYDKIIATRAWIQAHPLKKVILAFLTDPDPFA